MSRPWHITYQQDAFCPTYGHLGEFQAILPKYVVFQALSATLLQYIYDVIWHELLIRPNHLAIMLSTNCSNIIYTTAPIINNIHDFHNLDFLFPTNYYPPMIIPKTLIFYDLKQDATDATRYTNARLPQPLQNQGIIQHYHSDMSVEYLQQTYSNFANPDGQCCILHTTAGALTVSFIRSSMHV